MPLPSPNPKEEKDSFISRCVSKLHDMNEFDSQDQRLAVCYSQWKEKKENLKTVKVIEDVQIPGTNIILEKGDTVQIQDSLEE